MAIDYLPLLLLVIVATSVALIIIVVPALLGPRSNNPQKLEPYESGIIPFNDARRRFPIKYYLVAMLFLLFDIEVVFTYPWAVVLRDLRWQAIWPMAGFFFLLVFGLIYEWRKGGLEWED